MITLQFLTAWPQRSAILIGGGAGFGLPRRAALARNSDRPETKP
jgi:hypothetical protein